MIHLLQKIDITQIEGAYRALEDKLHWTRAGTKGLQTGLQFKLGDDPWTSATGSRQYSEVAYSNLNPFFKSTYFEEIVNQFNLLRTRLMWINPYSCYSLHRDEYPRIHIPLVTNPECYFIFPDSEESPITHLPAGNVYWVDTRQRHSFINCSPFERLHLVGVVEN